MRHAQKIARILGNVVLKITHNAFPSGEVLRRVIEIVQHAEFEPGVHAVFLNKKAKLNSENC